MAHPAALAATFIENWPDELRAHSMPTRSIPIGDDDLVALGGCSRVFRDAFERFERRVFTDPFLHAIEEALAAFANGVMPRIGYCSWKGSSGAPTPLLTKQDIMRTITRDDDRIARGLLPHAQTGPPAVLHLREWRDIPPCDEFRLFVRDRSLVGASQYHGERPNLAAPAEIEILSLALEGLIQRVSDAMPLGDVVLDTYVDRAANPWQAVVIELNPFDLRTDLCLFGSREEIAGKLRMAGGVVRNLQHSR